MYRYDQFDHLIVRQRIAQYRDQVRRRLSDELSEAEFLPLRLQNGLYMQRHAYMLRIAVPYGLLSSKQMRMFAHIAREYDRGYGHFTTRQNIQFNWIELEQTPDILADLASVEMHAIQTSGNCIRNITSDEFAGVASDEIIDPRPFAEILRQWSTFHPEFIALPRKFKVAINGALEDRAAIAVHDIGLTVVKNEAGEIGFKFMAGGGMGRTPILGSVIREFLPWQQILVFIEAIVRVYNRYGRRDNAYKARIKILVKAEGQKFIDAVNAEFIDILQNDVAGAAHVLPQAEFDRVAACFVQPAGVQAVAEAPSLTADAPPAFTRWLERNVHAHRVSGYRAVTLSIKRSGQAPGDVTADQMDAAAAIAERFSHAEMRVTHDQNLLLPWVRQSELQALWQAAREAGFASPNIGLLTDMIACPGGDFCALANARSIPLAEELAQRYAEIDELYDIGNIDLHISGCINSCGHHHSGHIGVLGVDKDGKEWYQISLGGSDGSWISGASAPGKVIGPSFAADEVADVIEAVVDTYRAERAASELFIDTVKRIGLDPFKASANAVRRSTALARRDTQTA